MLTCVTHRVFSYGTLRQPEVQRTLYGRVVPTVTDALPGYRLAWLVIQDPEVIRTSGSDRHPILQRDHDHQRDHDRDTDQSRVDGAYLELTDDELLATDRYEVDEYVRRSVTLSSGVTAWAYLAREDDAGDVSASADPLSR